MYLFFLIIWQIIIFIFSSHPAGLSSNISGGLTKSIIGFFAPDLNENKLDEMSVSLSYIVRKSAHFIAFFILGILMYQTLSENNKIKYKKTFAFVFCFIYAVLDEIHQLFVPGRAGRFSDVIIDSSGSILGIFIMFFVIKKIKYRH